MKHKNNITDENYEEVVLRRAINICWVLLAICFVVKIFGGNFFDIVCNNEKFVEFCSYVDKSKLLQFIIGCISTFITYTLFYLAICQKIWFTKRELVIVLVTTPVFVLLRMLNDTLAFIMNFIQLFAMPFIFKRNKSIILKSWFIRVLIYGNVLNFLFQLISMITKSQELGYLTNNFLVAIIFAIDVYIMLALYYLYSNKKRRNKTMSWFLNWLFGKSEAQLRNMKANRLAKIEKLQEEVNAIDEEINKKNESKD